MRYVVLGSSAAGINGIRGIRSVDKEGEIILDKVGITCNKNTVPFDDEKPFVTSGLRIGTASVTTRGMKEKEMIKIASFIDNALKNKDNDIKLNKIKHSVLELTKEFPLYEK